MCPHRMQSVFFLLCVIRVNLTVDHCVVCVYLPQTTNVLTAQLAS